MAYESTVLCINVDGKGVLNTDGQREKPIADLVRKSGAKLVLAQVQTEGLILVHSQPRQLHGASAHRLQAMRCRVACSVG